MVYVGLVIPSRIENPAARTDSLSLGFVVDMEPSTRRGGASGGAGGAGGVNGGGAGSTLGSGLGAGSSLLGCCPNSAISHASSGWGAYQGRDTEAPAARPIDRASGGVTGTVPS